MGNVGKTAFIFLMWFMYLFYQEMYTASLLVSHWYVIYSLFLCFFIFTSSMFIHVSVHHLLRDVTHYSNNFPLLSLSSSTFSAGQNLSFTWTYWLSFLFSRHFRRTCDDVPSFSRASLQSLRLWVSLDQSTMLTFV